jgi:methionyl-tRNA synthetase
MAREKYYITTPIYYVTAKPHLGSLYATLLADVLARWEKLQGKQVKFVTGTDEHGQKVAQAAQAAGKEPQDFVDSFIPAYKQAWHAYSIDYDRFIRTTEKSHIFGAQEFIKRLQANNAIYTAQYEGWYCTPCETFVTEKAIPGNGVIPPCPTCDRETQFLSEQTYFFRLSAYQDKLLKFFKENPDFIVPKERANEVISFVEGGLKDLSISRSTVKWGVPFPALEKSPGQKGDLEKNHTVYVWVEALCNYLTAVGYPQDPEQFAQWWPADLQVLGKDIVRFHAVYWPAFLMAAELPLPKRLLVHGWIKVDKYKMSKSRGNVIDPLALHAVYGSDPVRYYLMRYMAVNQDGEFTIPDLEQRITSELANDLGNLLQRMVTLALKNAQAGVQTNSALSALELESTIPAPALWSDKSMELRSELWDMVVAVQDYMNECQFHLAYARVWQAINKVNAYFHEQEPWKVAQKDPEKFKEVMSATAHSLRTIATILWPVMPNKMEQLLDSLGCKLSFEHNMVQIVSQDAWQCPFTLKKIPALFEKIEIKKEEPEQSGPADSSSGAHKSGENKVEKNNTQNNSDNMSNANITNNIDIEDFIKVELIVGTIITCEPVSGSDKLHKMQVDFGDKGTRQILSGVQKYYAPADLIGKQVVFVFNLKPRKMAGLESQGMMLTAQDEQGNPGLVTPAVPVANGTRLK